MLSQPRITLVGSRRVMLLGLCFLSAVNCRSIWSQQSNDLGSSKLHRRDDSSFPPSQDTQTFKVHHGHNHTSHGHNSTSHGHNSTSPGGNSTSPGGNSTSPGGNIPSPGGTSPPPGGTSPPPGGTSPPPGGNIPSPGVNSTSPGDNSTSPGGNSTSPPHHGTTIETHHKLPRMNGINLAGLEFGMNDGALVSGGYVPPPIDQLSHFIQQDGINLIRIPFGWQYVQTEIKGALNSTYLAVLDKYVDETLSLKAFAVISLQNFARRDGKIIGQSDLGADALADVWAKLADHYKSKSHVIFGLMNEPHDVVSKTWIDVVQQAVTAIRQTGAQNSILMPGNGYSHLATFADDYNAGMSSVKNPDGSTEGLVFEIHQYFDADGSGSGKGCSLDHITEFDSVAALLKKDGRQALIGEIGGDNSQSCVDILTKVVKTIDENYPAIAGSALWAAGSFGNDYPLMITQKDGNNWVDQPNFNAVKAVRSKSPPSS